MTRSRILVVDDERMIRWSIQQALSREGHSVAAVETGEEAVLQASDETPDLVFLDVTLPGIDGIETLRRLKAAHPSVTVVMITAVEDVKVVVDAMRLGAYDYVNKPFDLDRLKVIAQNALDRHELHQEVQFHRKESVKKYGFHRIVGSSRKMAEVVEIARKVARSEAATVLLQGESGTGKDLLAQAIHYESGRANRPFIPINCTALPEELLESELMGHEKGAFTDAKAAKKGLFEIADGGTIFLDEIGDMRPGLQAKLLRFIENKAFRRLGGHRDISVDVRIIAATNRELAQMVRSGTFREDLYFRLNVVPIVIPPLRVRPEDIHPLADHFLKEFASEIKRPLRGFSTEVRNRMLSYPWPGNVRELRNLTERAIILGTGDTIGVEDMPFPDTGVAGSGAVPLDGPVPEPPGAAPPATSEAVPRTAPRFPLPAEGVNLEGVERDFILQAMETTEGNQTRAAEMLGLTRDALRYRLKKFGFL